MQKEKKKIARSSRKRKKRKLAFTWKIENTFRHKGIVVFPKCIYGMSSAKSLFLFV